MFEIKKCGDCIHADVCEHNPNIPLFNRANAAFCEGFKDRNELIEVVRCKDCKKWFRHTQVDRERGDCRRYQTTKHESGFCDRGERKDND